MRTDATCSKFYVETYSEGFHVIFRPVKAELMALFQVLTAFSTVEQCFAVSTKRRSRI